jgi:hypothetical protein
MRIEDAFQQQHGARRERLLGGFNLLRRAP